MRYQWLFLKILRILFFDLISLHFWTIQVYFIFFLFHVYFYIYVEPVMLYCKPNNKLSDF